MIECTPEKASPFSTVPTFLYGHILFPSWGDVRPYTAQTLGTGKRPLRAP